MTLDLAETVAFGAFNPDVITPAWLVKYGICEPDEELDIRMEPVTEGESFVLGPVGWQVDGQKMSVSSADAAIDCGGMVSRVLELAPHTPVRAIGHNFHFTASKLDWGGRPTPKLGGRGIEDLDGAEQVRWSGIFRKDDARLEVMLADEAELVAILLNYHRNIDLERAAAETPSGQIIQARGAAELFRQDFNHSCTLLRSLFQVEMSDS